jgi:hypothetical protein
VRVDPAPEPGGGWVVGVAATTVKGYEIFEERFRDLVGALDGSLNPPDAPGHTSPAESAGRRAATTG